MMERYENLEQQQHSVQAALQGNGLSYEVAVWLADLHIRVRQCEIALLKADLAEDSK